MACQCQPRGLRSWLDFVRECFCCGGEAVNASGEVARGLAREESSCYRGARNQKWGSTAKYRSLPNPAGYASYPPRKAHDELYGLFNFLWKKEIDSKKSIHIFLVLARAFSDKHFSSSQTSD